MRKNRFGFKVGFLVKDVNTGRLWHVCDAKTLFNGKFYIEFIRIATKNESEKNKYYPPEDPLYRREFSENYFEGTYLCCDGVDVFRFVKRPYR